MKFYEEVSVRVIALDGEVFLAASVEDEGDINDDRYWTDNY